MVLLQVLSSVVCWPQLVFRQQVNNSTKVDQTEPLGLNLTTASYQVSSLVEMSSRRRKRVQSNLKDKRVGLNYLHSTALPR